MGNWKTYYGRRLTALCLAAAMLSGCQGSTAQPAATSENVQPMAGQGRDEAMGRKNTDMEGAVPEVLTYAADDYENWNRVLEENRISDEFRSGLLSFAFKSGSALLKQENGNCVYSPLSLSFALALAGYGAEDETASQILRELGMTDRGELAKECGNLFRRYAYQEQRDKLNFESYGQGTYDSRIRLANSLWISDSLKLKEEYQKAAADEFYASSYSVDFRDKEAGEQIGRWIADKTEGVLKPQLNLAPETLLTLVNTLYFYGGWRDQFLPELTKEDTFTLKGGEKITVPFLNRTDIMGSFKKGDGYLVSSLGTNNNCEMVFLLPDEGRDTAEFLGSPEALSDALGGGEEDYVSGEVVWKVPKFSFGSSFDLEKMLRGLGMERMFGENAQFGGISDQPLLLSAAIQEAHIGIDENGVEGAAYTMLAMAGGAAVTDPRRAEMRLDRPFLFGIRDISNDVWLFLGVCQNPAQGDA